MTDEEALAACLAGLRVTTDTTLTDFRIKPGECRRHQYRVVACTSTRDVVECLLCGYQTTSRCNFDEEYA